MMGSRCRFVCLLNVETLSAAFARCRSFHKSCSAHQDTPQPAFDCYSGLMESKFPIRGRLIGSRPTTKEEYSMKKGYRLPIVETFAEAEFLMDVAVTASPC